ncbi:MAG: GlxA family transcriptional regulator [Proteobacteria bacterium]|nr:GlxA family transcriptional regulator [Pseudomonadota bacterium]
MFLNGAMNNPVLPFSALSPVVSDPPESRFIVMLVYPGIMAMDVYGPLEAFAMANSSSGRTLYRMAIASIDGAPVPTSLGVPITPSMAAGDIKEPIDTLLVSGGRGQAEARRDQALIGWLRAGSREARRTGSICTGAFLLAAAGLLDGRRATTHWAMGAELGQNYPKVTVDIDPIFVRDGNVYTSAGVTAGIDLALGLIEEDHGRTLALHVARALVLYLKRQGGQSQFSNHLQAQFASSPPVRSAQEWALNNLSMDLSVEALARQARMSERTFRRTFVEETGETPREFVERIRLEAARDLLEEVQLGVQAVATRCGFATVDNLRRAFVRRLGITPQQYRLRFAGQSAG